MVDRGKRQWPVAIGLAVALLAAGCSNLADDGLSSEGIAVTAGASDGGSFVGAPGAVGDETAFGGEEVTADGDDTDPVSGATPETETDTDAFGEGPGLSTDPDVVFLPGTCFRPESADAEAVEVPCSEPHNIEVYAIVDLPGGKGAPFLGFDPAIELCDAEFIQITGIGLGLATVYQRSVLRPSEDTWADGERDVTCYVEYPEQTTEALANIDPVRDFGVVSIYGLEVGDCFDEFDDTQSNFVPISCDEPHDAEVFVDFEYPAGPYPGEDAIDEMADELCFGQTFEDFIGLDYQNSAIFALRSRPTEETWNLGDRTINCILTDEETRTGSLQGSGI